MSEQPTGMNPDNLRAYTEGDQDRVVLTPDKAKTKQLFILSFYFSQGHVGLQRLILEWLVKEGHFPTSEMTSDIPFFLKEVSPPEKHIKSDKATITKDRNWAYSTLSNQFRRPTVTKSGTLVPKILSGMIKRDIKFLLLGRPGRKEEQDQYESFVRNYIVEAHTTGSFEFDTMNTLLRANYAEAHKISQNPIDANILEHPDINEIRDAFLIADKDKSETAINGLFETIGITRSIEIHESLWEARHPIDPTSQRSTNL